MADLPVLLLSGLVKILSGRKFTRAVISLMVYGRIYPLLLYNLTFSIVSDTDGQMYTARPIALLQYTSRLTNLRGRL